MRVDYILFRVLRYQVRCIPYKIVDDVDHLGEHFLLLVHCRIVNQHNGSSGQSNLTTRCQARIGNRWARATCGFLCFEKEHRYRQVNVDLFPLLYRNRHLMFNDASLRSPT